MFDESRFRQIIREELTAVLKSGAVSMTQPPATDFLTYEEAAALAKVCKSTVKSWVRRGGLKTCGRGRKKLIARPALLEFLTMSPTSTTSIPGAFASSVLKIL